MTLPRKYGRHTGTPGLFDRRQDARLVVYQDVVLGRIKARNILKFEFLVDIDKDVLI